MHVPWKDAARVSTRQSKLKGFAGKLSTQVTGRRACQKAMSGNLCNFHEYFPVQVQDKTACEFRLCLVLPLPSFKTIAHAQQPWTRRFHRDCEIGMHLNQKAGHFLGPFSLYPATKLVLQNSVWTYDVDQQGPALYTKGEREREREREKGRGSFSFSFC